MEPTSLTAEITAVLLRDLDGFRREILLFPDDESPWMTQPGVANSAGNLALHIAGNIRHFIGSNLGGIPYSRDRDDEFGRREGTRDMLVAELDRALEVVKAVMPALSPSQLDEPFPGATTPVPVTTRKFLFHLATHVAFHLGQAGYLRRIVTGNPQSTNTVTSARLT
jgi:uncharacterized damage-inducible protein DinB